MCILGQRNFGASEAAALAAALATNTSLRELMASGHPLRPEEASAFGRSLSRNKTLQSLCLGDNHFGDEVGRGKHVYVRPMQWHSIVVAVRSSV